MENTVGGNVNWCSHYEKQYRGSKLKLSYVPAIPLLSRYPEKTKTLIGKDTCTAMFTAPLFTIGKAWKQPQGPSTDDRLKKRWCAYARVHIVDYHSVMEKEWNIATRSNRDGPKECHTQRSQTEKDKHYMTSLTCQLKNNPKLYTQNRNRLTGIEMILQLTRGWREWVGIN